MHRTLGRTLPWLAVGLALAVTLGPAAFAGDAPNAEEVFGKLKTLAGTWEGKAGEEELTAQLVFEVSAAGTVVMETMAPGTEHEMINMYHLDGDDLVVTHYCAGGNQPHMRWNPAKGDAADFHFDFDGGTNLDPATDHHIHGLRVMMVDDDTLESHWSSWGGGEEQGVMKFRVDRIGGE